MPDQRPGWVHGWGTTSVPFAGQTRYVGNAAGNTGGTTLVLSPPKKVWDHWGPRSEYDIATGQLLAPRPTGWYAGKTSILLPRYARQSGSSYLGGVGTGNQNTTHTLSQDPIFPIIWIANSEINGSGLVTGPALTGYTFTRLELLSVSASNTTRLYIYIGLRTALTVGRSLTHTLGGNFQGSAYIEIGNWLGQIIEASVTTGSAGSSYTTPTVTARAPEDAYVSIQARATGDTAPGVSDALVPTIADAGIARIAFGPVACLRGGPCSVTWTFGGTSRAYSSTNLIIR